MRTRRAKAWAGASIIALVAVFGRADDASDRTQLMSQIESKLGEAASSLAGVPSARAPSGVDDAVGKIREVEELVGKLDAVKGDDDAARRAVERSREYLPQFYDAAKGLRALKEKEYTVDDAAARCKEAEQGLSALLREYVGNANQKATEGLEKIPEAARSLGAQWAPELDRWKALGDEVQEGGRKANLSARDGGWSDVSTRLNGATEDVIGHWSRAYGDAQRDCGRLALGDKHPDVVKALQDLSAFTGDVRQTYRQLKIDYDGWFRDVKKLREFTNQDLTDVRDAICNSGEYEVEQKVGAIADRWSAQISSAYGTITGQADRLLARADAIMSRAPKSTPKLVTAIRDNLASLDRIKESELRGAANPKIRTRIEYGKQEHQRRQASCTYSELAISSRDCSNEVRTGGCKLDCVMIPACRIIEIKPRNGRAEKEGEDQLRDYKKGLEAWFQRDATELLGTYQELNRCVTGEGVDRAIHLDTDLQTYEFCPPSNADVGEVIEEVADEVPDEATEVSR